MRTPADVPDAAAAAADALRVSYFYDLPLPAPLAAAIQFLNTCRELACLGVPTTVYAGPVRADCLAFHGLAPHEKLSIVPLFSRLPGRPELSWRLRGIVRAQRGERAHFLISRGETGVALLPRLRRLGLPPSAHLVHEAHRLGFAHEAERESGRRWHPGDALSRNAERTREQEREAVEAADAILCLTPAVEHALKAEFRVACPTLVLPSGVALPVELPRGERDIDVIYAGKLEARKGLATLLAAMAHLPGRRLWVLGGDTARVGEHRRLAAELGVAEQVTFTGFIEPARVPQYLARARRRLSAADRRERRLRGVHESAEAAGADGSRRAGRLSRPSLRARDRRARPHGAARASGRRACARRRDRHAARAPRAGRASAPGRTAASRRVLVGGAGAHAAGLPARVGAGPYHREPFGNDRREHRSHDMTRDGTGPHRFSITRGRISRDKLDRFCRDAATDDYTLVVHSVDVDHKHYFPNSFVVGKRKDRPANLYTDASFNDLQSIGSESFAVVVCTGLLEHVPNPERIVGECHRILKPGGRLVISASAVFPFHGAPDNYFHFTTHGFRHLFRNWSRFEVLQGSTRPFETIAILLQRISLQCDLVPLFRPLLVLLYRVVPVLDVFVRRQYDSAGDHGENRVTDAFMPATLHAVVIK